MDVKGYYLLVITLVVMQLSFARNFRHEAIIKRRLSETRLELEAIKTHHFAVLLPLDDVFMRNFSAVVEHGEFVTSYLLRNARFEIENVEFEAAKCGIHIDACTSNILHDMDSLPKTTADDINTSKDNFSNKYHQMYEHFVKRGNSIEKRLQDSERLIVDCQLEKGCFDIVMMQIDEVEQYMNADLVNDLKLQIEAFMMMMHQQYHVIQGFYLQLYENIRTSEAEFRNCYKERLRF